MLQTFSRNKTKLKKTTEKFHPNEVNNSHATFHRMKEREKEKDKKNIVDVHRKAKHIPV